MSNVTAWCAVKLLPAGKYRSWEIRAETDRSGSVVRQTAATQSRWIGCCLQMKCGTVRRWRGLKNALFRHRLRLMAAQRVAWHRTYENSRSISSELGGISRNDGLDSRHSLISAPPATRRTNAERIKSRRTLLRSLAANERLYGFSVASLRVRKSS